MLNFFTDPYKDELLYSAIARYHFYIGNIDCMDTLEEMFGKRSIVPSFEIGSNIENLCNNLGNNYTSDYIINNHTVFPFYAPFQPESRKAALIEQIKHENGKGLYNKLGMAAGGICKKYGIYYCPCCAKKDIEKYGEPYIHREHQLQGVLICPHEGEELKKYPIDKTNSSNIEFIRLDEKLLDLKSTRKIEGRYYEILYKLSKDAYFLLQTDLHNISKNDLLEKYMNYLFVRGLATSGMRVKSRELYEEFISFYGMEFLDMMECSIDYDNGHNWFRKLTSNSKTVHPIRNLLFINFLNADIYSFFHGIKKQYNPFGKGPWACLNKISDHYKKDVVNNLKITYDGHPGPVGTFSCKCGFVHSRRGPDKVKNDKYKIGKIKHYGKVWENKLISYLEEKRYGPRELARLMYCGNKTVVKYDRLLGINYLINYSYIVRHKEKPTSDLLEKSKENLLKAIEMNPMLKRSEIQNMYSKEFSYLYKHSKKWLFCNLPITAKNTSYGKSADWNKRDIKLIALIKEKYEEMINRDVPIRITKASIGRVAGITWYIDKKLNELPKTEKYLNEVLETVEHFQIRRCKKIIDSKIENDEDIWLSDIQVMGGLRTVSFKKLKIELEEYISLKTKGNGYI